VLPYLVVCSKLFRFLPGAIYTQLVEFEGDEYHSAIAHNLEEAQKLVEAKFEYVCSHNEAMLFRKRK
jgi:hypothetical protein